MKERNIVLLQARLSSKRLPGKVLKDLNGVPMILQQIKRIKLAKEIDKILIVTSDDPTDDLLVTILDALQIESYRGSLENVYERFCQAMDYISKDFQTIIRLTADCPLICPELIDLMVNEFNHLDLDYLSNTLFPTFPNGLDVEVFNRKSLFTLKNFKLSDYEKEHVTPGIYSRPNMFSLGNFQLTTNYSNLRWTVDNQTDLSFIMSFFKSLHFDLFNPTFIHLLNVCGELPIHNFSTIRNPAELSQGPWIEIRKSLSEF